MQFARIGKALASPARLELLDLLAQGERSVEDLAREAHLSLANASAHLRVLSHAHVVIGRHRWDRRRAELAQAAARPSKIRLAPGSSDGEGAS